MPEVRLVDLRKEYPGVVAVKNVNITFATGTVTCLLGPSGCGKTTMMRIIAGLETATAGDVFFGDDRITDLPTRKREIGMVFQYPVVYRSISVYRNIELPLLEEKLPESERKKRIRQVIEILGLEDSAEKDISQLDGGTRQKVAIARTVARQPAVILFDEPITSVDAEAKVQLKRALKELTRQLRQTIIYVTHDQTEAMTLADQIALMKDGEIVQLDAPRKLYNRPDDVFGGWFLGNPGMNFFEHRVETLGDSPSLTSLQSHARRCTLGSPHRASHEHGVHGTLELHLQAARALLERDRFIVKKKGAEWRPFCQACSLAAFSSLSCTAGTSA